MGTPGPPSPFPHPHSLRLSQHNKQNDSVIGGLGAFSPVLKPADGCPCESVESKEFNELWDSNFLSKSPVPLSLWNHFLFCFSLFHSRNISSCLCCSLFLLPRILPLPPNLVFISTWFTVSPLLDFAVIIFPVSYLPTMLFCILTLLLPPEFPTIILYLKLKYF